MANIDLDQLNVYLIETTMVLYISSGIYKKNETKILLKKNNLSFDLRSLCVLGLKNLIQLTNKQRREGPL